MNASKFAIVALLAAASLSSMAAPVDNPTPGPTLPSSLQSVDSGEAYMGYTAFVSTKTRAEVIQDLLDARRRGEIHDGEDYPGPLVTPTGKTRAEVVTELKKWRQTHPQVSDDGAFSF